MFNYLKSRLLLVIGLIFVSFGCKEKNKIELKVPLNTFSMNVNKQLWQPSVIDKDPCYATFRCEWSAQNNIPFYIIRAYKDSQSRADYTSENYFRLQIMNVQSEGNYSINEPYDDFTSYARFIKNDSGNQTIYENSANKLNSSATIEEIISIEGSGFTGIKGSFSGILYNINNQNDSIIIDKCNFTFNKVNWANFCQCSE